MKETRTARGAWVLYRYEDDDPTTEPRMGYISFGDYDEDADTDTFGVPDTKVFYYSSAEELPTLTEQGAGHDFYLVEYSVVYAK